MKSQRESSGFQSEPGFSPGKMESGLQVSRLGGRPPSDEIGSLDQSHLLEKFAGNLHDEGV